LKALKGKSRIIKAGPDSCEGIDEAKGVLLSGGVVAFPTESFYGLAVNPMDEEAIDLLFRLKQREADQPILLLIPCIEFLDTCVLEVPEVARCLMKKHWPGGLTLLFKARPSISQRLTAGTGKIGIRFSSHPIATALARSVNSPITGTSANRSGRPACTSAIEVYDHFKEGILILDGGIAKGGSGSTILDVTIDPPGIVREGMISARELGLGGLSGVS
jgi:L-threonylcarbamoyladenylate synthase